MLKIFEVRMARIQLNNCNDHRPCVLITDPQENKVQVMAISSADLNENIIGAFHVRADHPDFRDTGLERSSYVLVDIYVKSINNIGNKIGAFTGDLLKDFQKWV